ncbi:hypothetical protein KU306_10485 [Haloferax larsenii]|uniref:Flagellin n=1 Tax=Haloferax larsenii TaxID=302484 RepID=A0ABY5RCP6_HALLR|nr:hypothetical protein [Haloferax larsenii]UVE49350.1 hypothetical protein KU306_10485 [Haloferax larsenii]
MADVTPRETFAADDRGQLFLVTALTIAVLLVGLALTLNTAIYTENVATRTTDTQLDDATSFQQALFSGGGEVLDSANRAGGGESTIESQFQSSITNWSVETASLSAVYGRSVDVTYTGTMTGGARIHQDDSTRTFTNETAGDTWVAVTDEEVRNVRFNVSRTSLAGNAGDAFHFVIDDDGVLGDAVVVSFHDDGTNVVVTVENDTGVVGTCAVEPKGTDESLIVDVTGGTVGPKRCLPLDTIHETFDGNVHVVFENGDEATGTYEFYTTTKNTGVSSLVTGPHYAGTGSGSWPVAEEALYDANVTYVFSTDETTVEKTIRLAPGEIA